eukprot:358313-Chlamydomonas_euryale.AAC.4
MFLSMRIVLCVFRAKLGCSAKACSGWKVRRWRKPAFRRQVRRWQKSVFRLASAALAKACVPASRWYAGKALCGSGMGVDTHVDNPAAGQGSLRSSCDFTKLDVFVSKYRIGIVCRCGLPECWHPGTFFRGTCII